MLPLTVMWWGTRILACIALCWGARAHAQVQHDVGVKLSWVREPGADACPTSTALELDVQQRLGRNPFHEPVAQTLEGVVRRGDDGRYGAVLYHRDASGNLVGTRELTSAGPGCDALASALSLALALAIDPEAALAPEKPKAALSESPPSRALATPQAAGPNAEPRGRGRPSAGRVSLGALLTWELVPGLAPGLSLDADGRALGLARWLVGMVYLPEQRTGELGFGITAARLGACLLREYERLSVGGCAAAALGAIHAVSYALAPVEPGDWFFASADVSAEGSVVVLQPVFVGASLGLTVPLVRHRFRVQGRDSAEFQEPVAAPRLVFSLGVRFP